MVVALIPRLAARPIIASKFSMASNPCRRTFMFKAAAQSRDVALRGRVEQLLVAAADVRRVCVAFTQPPDLRHPMMNAMQTLVSCSINNIPSRRADSTMSSVSNCRCQASCILIESFENLYQTFAADLFTCSFQTLEQNPGRTRRQSAFHHYSCGVY